ncbi:MAG TPA: cytochrome b N-terminal domain-containing protein [Actinomycetota bacterium]|nr:cytochrome b N-terminal domain-containing protein [Actinomycetota bacterium]
MSTERPPIRERGWYLAMFHPGRSFAKTELYTSAIRHPAPSTPRGRAMTSFHSFFLHLYPVKVPKAIVRTRTTLRLGFIAATLYLILFVSGMYLMFFYHPAAPDAYFDMHSLSTAVAFGRFVRNVHRWSAHLMVLVVFLHLLRVFYAGAYRRPRQFNWVIGVVLLVLTLLMSFTGYLLPWDQLSYWAITVGTNIAGYIPILGSQARTLLLGGNEVSSATLLRFYVLHIYFLPALMVVVIAIHIWRVRKDNFAVVDRREDADADVPVHTEEVTDVDTGA